MAEEKELKYGVVDLAEAMGVEPASARVWLRNNKIKKEGRSYGWKTKAEVEALVKQHADARDTGRATNLDKANAKKATTAKKATIAKKKAA